MYWRRLAVVVAVFTVGIFLIAFHTGHSSAEVSLEANNTTISHSHSHRKLLSHEEIQLNRMWGERCSKEDIVINQGSTAPLPSGIPTYTVEIMNVCSTGCDISEIHLSCKWFSSARLINPKIFKRAAYDDCLVNDGKTLSNGRTISFAYANTFRYPLSVSHIVCQ